MRKNRQLRSDVRTIKLHRGQSEAALLLAPTSSFLRTKLLCPTGHEEVGLVDRAESALEFVGSHCGSRYAECEYWRPTAWARGNAIRKIVPPPGFFSAQRRP
jgi:hypothetical protein